jgi:hypothetical protein
VRWRSMADALPQDPTRRVCPAVTVWHPDGFQVRIGLTA